MEHNRYINMPSICPHDARKKQYREDVVLVCILCRHVASCQRFMFWQLWISRLGHIRGATGVYAYSRAALQRERQYIEIRFRVHVIHVPCLICSKVYHIYGGALSRACAPRVVEKLIHDVQCVDMQTRVRCWMAFVGDSVAICSAKHIFAICAAICTSRNAHIGSNSL
jgi:hypothetical protein